MIAEPEASWLDLPRYDAAQSYAFNYEHAPEHPFLGARIASDSAASSALVHDIERAAHALVKDALQRAQQVLDEQPQAFQQLVAALQHNEALDRQAIEQALKPQPQDTPEPVRGAAE